MRGSKRRWPWVVATVVVVAVGLALLMTGARPWVPERRAATAQEVDTARAAFRQIKLGRQTGKPGMLRLYAADVDAIDALVSQGFAPTRLDLKLGKGAVAATVSRPMLGRWVNIRVEAHGTSVGFPALRTRIGMVVLPGWASRIGLNLGRWVLLARGAHLPPLDQMVQSSRIVGDIAEARILLPKSGLVDQTVVSNEVAIDDAAVAKIYCSLTRAQRAAHERSFSQQLRRAFSAAAATPEGHGAAFVALAMFAVDPRAGQLAGYAQAKARPCLAPVPTLTLDGRGDSPKHWALSAALTVTTGGEFATAMGEWKELSDSLKAGTVDAPGDRSGFSFVDLATDRAGYLYARKAIDPARMASARARLLAASDEMLLPVAMTKLNDGMDNGEFVRRFGGTDDARFQRALARIDGALKAAGID